MRGRREPSNLEQLTHCHQEAFGFLKASLGGGRLFNCRRSFL